MNLQYSAKTQGNKNVHHKHNFCDVKYKQQGRTDMTTKIANTMYTYLCAPRFDEKSSVLKKLFVRTRPS